MNDKTSVLCTMPDGELYTTTAEGVAKRLQAAGGNYQETLDILNAGDRLIVDSPDGQYTFAPCIPGLIPAGAGLLKTSELAAQQYKIDKELKD